MTAEAATIAVTAAGALNRMFRMGCSLLVLWWILLLICGSFRLDTQY
jgi:hypothetical protein